jgi:hypothetical protein
MLRETAGEPCLIFAREVEMLRLISRREGIAGIRTHAEDMLAPLVEHDAQASGALLQTLTAFVDCEAQIRATAAQLGVHENTVRYRLKRISEISTIDPFRLDSLFSVGTALQVRRLSGAKIQAPSLPAVRIRPGRPRVIVDVNSSPVRANSWPWMFWLSPVPPARAVP